jgi:lysophospholipase L1-like esterase
VHDEGGPDALMVDGIHLNERGHMLLAQKLEDQVLSVLSVTK